MCQMGAVLCVVTPVAAFGHSPCGHSPCGHSLCGHFLVDIPIARCPAIPHAEVRGASLLQGGAELCMSLLLFLLGLYEAAMACVLRAVLCISTVLALPLAFCSRECCC